MRWALAVVAIAFSVSAVPMGRVKDAVEVAPEGKAALPEVPAEVVKADGAPVDKAEKAAPVEDKAAPAAAESAAAAENAAPAAPVAPAAAEREANLAAKLDAKPDAEGAEHAEPPAADAAKDAAAAPAAENAAPAAEANARPVEHAATELPDADTAGADTAAEEVPAHTGDEPSEEEAAAMAAQLEDGPPGGYDEERLYADQEEDFEAYNEDDEDGPREGDEENKPKEGKAVRQKEHRDQLKSDMDAEYERYVKEMESDLMNDPSKFHEMMAELEELRGQPEGLDAEQHQLLKIGEKLRAKEHARTRLEEQQRIAIERQRRMAERAKLHKEGLDSRAGEAELGDTDADIFMNDKVDNLKLIAIAKKRADQMEHLDQDRRRAFLQHEMARLLKFKQLVEHESDPAKKQALIKAHDDETKVLTERRGHAPGHEKQMKEVWEKDDGLNPNDFDPKTFFRLHDITSDGVLDAKELEGMFYSEAKRLHEVAIQSGAKKITDEFVVGEEMARMREFMMKSVDKDGDGMVSEDEFTAMSKSSDFKKDKQWKPVNPEAEITEKQMGSFKKLQQKLSRTAHNELDPELVKAADRVARDFEANAQARNEKDEAVGKAPRFPNMKKGKGWKNLMQQAKKQFALPGIHKLGAKGAKASKTGVAGAFQRAKDAAAAALLGSIEPAAKKADEKAEPAPEEKEK